MLKKYNESKVPAYAEELEVDKDLKDTIKEEVANVQKYMENFDVSKSLASIFNIFSKANKYIELTEPFILAKDEEQKGRLHTVLRNLLESIRIGTLLLKAFLPDCSSKVLSNMGIDNEGFENLDKFYSLVEDSVIEPVDNLFPRLDIEKEKEELANLCE